jgi:hypothetical protein
VINTSSIESLMESLPAIPDELGRSVMAKTRRPDAISPATASLAQRGFFGCFPFAHHEANELVVHIEPGSALNRSRVAVAWWNILEATSIAADLEHFVAGRLAQMDAADPRYPLGPHEQHILIELSAQFGDPGHVRTLLDNLAAASKIRDDRERIAALFGMADPADPFGNILANVWAKTSAEMTPWLSNAIRTFGHDAIVQRLWLSTHVNRRSDADLAEVAWKIICGDDVFDPTYTGEIRGPAMGVYKRSAMVKAIRWCDEHDVPVPDPVLDPVWNAASMLARDPKTYDGASHLTAARSLASARPTLAYTLACNAAMFEVRATGRVPVASLVFCHELAIANHWADLVTLLGWSRTEMGL